MAFKPPSGGDVISMTIMSLLGISAAASLYFAGGVPNGCTFLDQDKNVSSSAYCLFDGTTPTSRAGTMAIGASATNSSAILVVGGNNSTNMHGILIDGMGAGTSGLRINRSGQGNWVFDNGAPGNSFRMIATNMGLNFTANSNAYDLTNPAGITYQSIGVPTRIGFWFNGAVGQSGDLVNFRTENGSSTPVFAIGAQGKTAIGVGASTSSNAMLSVNGGTTVTTTASFGDADTPGCIAIGDTDRGGITYLYTLNGVPTYSTTDCN